MKAPRSFIALFLAAILVSSASASEVKSRLETMKAAGKPEVITVDHDMFTCSSCDPEIKVKVSASPQKVAGHSAFDSVVVVVHSPSKVEVVEEREHKNVRFYNYDVSADGKSLEVKYVDYSGPKGVRGGYTATRVAAGPAGAHAVSGSWRIEKTEDEQDAPPRR
jgi:hypothetical protein